MGKYIVTDLTKLDGSNVCVGVIDISTGKCLRPWTPNRLTSEWIKEHDIQPGVKLDGKITVSPDVTRPHIEDAYHVNLINLGPLPATEFKKLLEESVANSVSAGLQASIPDGDRCVHISENPVRSLVTIKASHKSFSVSYDHENNKLRASFSDGSGQLYENLPIGDICLNRAFSLCGNLTLEELNQFLLKQEEIYLRIGLTRKYKGQEVYWLQLNGIYVFPDLRKKWMSNSVYTIGHSTHSGEKFLSLLQSNKITAVADVRSVPYSKYNPHFNENEIAKLLQNHHIKYVHLGQEFGARRDDSECYTNGRVDFAKVAKTDSFGKGLSRIRKGSETYRIALMCAEKKPEDCHRTYLVAEELYKLGFNLYHILEDGSKESHCKTRQRLTPKQADLLRSKEQEEELALRVRGNRISYKNDNLA